MSNLAIKVENVSKMYRLGDVGTGTIGDDITRFWYKIRGKEDPFSKLAISNDRSQKAQSDYVLSLKDINFEIKAGDAVGIIGRNGAGKSTLLKILSKITAPTTGNIKINGRVASLLEVGTGFNPDLTGRQNIYMNGAILGMTRAEVTKKLDEIIDFSGVEGYIDTPVKRYSSGMYVRLAFAVAAHLEPEILIVDEVLAVGDAEFQKKCLGKMNDVNSKDGRTILFVSHNLAAIKTLCNKGIFLKNGCTEYVGSIEDTLVHYQEELLVGQNMLNTSLYTALLDSEKKAQILLVKIVNEHGIVKKEFDVWDQVYVEFEYVINIDNISSVTPIINLEKDGVELLWSFASDLEASLLEKTDKGCYKYKIKLPCPLKKGHYSISAKVGRLRVGDLDAVLNSVNFHVEEFSFDPTIVSYASNRGGIIPALLEWKRV